MFDIEPSTSVQLLQLDDGLLPLLTSLGIPEISGGEYFGDYRGILPFLLPSFLRSRSISEVICTFDSDDEDDDDLDGVVLSLAKHANVKVLHRLTLGGSLYPEYISSLSHLNHLRSVSLSLSKPCWTFDVFDLLSRLQLIDVRLDFHTASSSPMRSMTSGAFPVMTALSLRGGKPLIHYMLNGIAGDNLESIQIAERFTKYNLDNAYQHACFYHRLAKFTLLRSISHTVQEMEWEILSPHEPGIIPMSVIQPLTGLKHLESLKLMFLAPWFHVPDPEISIVASTWPHLRVLGLKPIPLPWPVNTQHPTLISLHSLALNCSKLVYLAINVNMQASLSLSDLSPISSHGHCPLKTLELYGNVFNDSLYTAQVLEYLFPRLTYITSRDKDFTAIPSYLGLIKHDRLPLQGGFAYALPHLTRRAVTMLQLEFVL
jgi:hypothetical protein